jgi:hypothetical protein
MHIVKTFEAGTLPDQGDALGEEVDKALDQFDLEDKLSDELIENDPSIEEVSKDRVDDLEQQALDDDPFTNPDVEAADD